MTSSRGVWEATITARVAGAAGYFVLVIVAFVVAALLFPTGGGTTGSGGTPFQLGAVIVPLVVMAIPV